MSLQTPHARDEQCVLLRSVLLDLHRTLIELERREYEKVHGRQSAGDFLQLVAFGESMRWLEPLSRLIVMLDEALDPKGDLSMAPAPAIVAERTRQLLRLDGGQEQGQGDDFSSHYMRHFHGSPDLAVEHAAVLRVLNAQP